MRVQVARVFDIPLVDHLLEACLDDHYVAIDQLVRELVGAAAGADPGAFIETAARRLYRFVLAERPQLLLRAATNAQRGGLRPERQGEYFEQLSFSRRCLASTRPRPG